MPAIKDLAQPLNPPNPPRPFGGSFWAGWAGSVRSAVPEPIPGIFCSTRCIFHSPSRQLLLITLLEGLHDRAGWAPRPPKLVLLKSLKSQALGHLDGLGGSFGQTTREMPDWPEDDSEWQRPTHASD
jgi:hypothetical protein